MIWLYILSTFALLPLSTAQFSSYFDGVELPRIAIVGGGIGGSTVAYQLQEIFGMDLPSVDLYEGHEIGGRLRTVNIGGDEYEAGGAIIHPANEHMVNFAKLLKLEQLLDDGGNFAMFDGKEKVFEVSKSSWISTLQLLWRYGLSLFRLEKSTSHFLTDFERIYKWQKEHQSFTSVPNLLLAMSDELMNGTKTSLRDLLLTEGVSKQLIDELATAATHTNYGQSPSVMHATVGSVSVAGAQSGLWAVKGGNCKVPEGLLKLTETQVIHGEIARITNASTDADKPLFKLETTDGVTKHYDVVVLAAPLIKGRTNIEFSGFHSDFTEHQREYHHLPTYFIQGVPNYQYFGYKSLEDMPSVIFPIGAKEFYNSLGEITPVSGTKASNQVYKVFTNNPLTDSQLDTLFSTREITQLVDWYPYPEYNTNMNFVPFVLAPKLYYVNAIELAASAMEMSAVAGVNVASLLVHEWMGHDHFVDNLFVIEEKHLKIEL